MSFAGPVLQGASGLMQAYGQVKAGEDANKSYEFNARQAEQNAAQAKLIAAQEERQVRIIGRKTIGSMQADYGASGVNMEGSPMEVLASSAAAAELDALNVRYGGESRARNFMNEATVMRFQGATAKSAGYYGAASTLLNTGAKIMGSSGGGMPGAGGGGGGGGGGSRGYAATMGGE